MDDPEVCTLLRALAERRWTVAVAEGDTGGVLLDWLTAVPGSSAVVRGGVVAYHDDLKRDLLGVAPALIEQHGAVSLEAARAMAEGIRRLARADLGLATTGIAGPAGGTATKPVGLAFIAAAGPHGRMEVHQCQWQGDRAANRQSSAAAALQVALQFVESEK